MISAQIQSYTNELEHLLCFMYILWYRYRYEPGRRDLHECRYNQNVGYVLYSAMGSFFIPMAVMLYVYVRISCVVAARHDHMTEIEVHKVIAQVNIYIVTYITYLQSQGWSFISFNRSQIHRYSNERVVYEHYNVVN